MAFDTFNKNSTRKPQRKSRQIRKFKKAAFKSSEEKAAHNDAGPVTDLNDDQQQQQQMMMVVDKQQQPAQILTSPEFNFINLTSQSDFMTVEDAEKISTAYKEVKRNRRSLRLRTVPIDFNDTEALDRHLKNVELKIPDGSKRIPWIETLTLVSNASVLEEQVKVGEDFRKEAAFQAVTLASVKEGLRRIKSVGLNFSRPDDFFAEMLKSDIHMRRVRLSLADQEARITSVENRKKYKIEKKFSKAVQVEKIKYRQQQKKRNLQKIEQWKNKKQRGKI